MNFKNIFTKKVSDETEALLAVLVNSQLNKFATINDCPRPWGQRLRQNIRCTSTIKKHNTCNLKRILKLSISYNFQDLVLARLHRLYIGKIPHPISKTLGSGPLGLKKYLMYTTRP